ncbi:MAG: hypothetical protein RMM58_09740 [Chloroflexota bacterium]|nr:hypothetical protein [Dehalococcoidia bacterium]MDW8254150.1 hypothetical protein [Chloroflexota bacterium]
MERAVLRVRLRPWLRRLPGAFAVAIIAAMAAIAIRRWEDVRAQEWQVAPALLALSVAIVVAVVLLGTLAWAVVVRHLGAARASVREIASIYLYSNLARYLPGAVWNLAARAYLGHRQGLGQRQIWIATAIDLTVAVATGLLLYSVTVAAGGAAVVPPLLAAGGALALFAAVSPPSLRRLSRLLGRGAGPTEVLQWRVYIAYLGASCAAWGGMGVAFFFFVAGLYPVTGSFALSAIGLWSLSAVAGLAAVGVPQGVGVKEGVLVLGLSSALPAPAALAIALASRLWLMLCDVIAAGVWWGAAALAARSRCPRRR